MRQSPVWLAAERSLIAAKAADNIGDDNLIDAVKDFAATAKTGEQIVSIMMNFFDDALSAQDGSLAKAVSYVLGVAKYCPQHESGELGDLQTAVEYAAELLGAIADKTSSDLTVRRAAAPLLCLIDEGFSGRLRPALLCLYQAGLLSCFLRSAPNLEMLRCVMGGSKEALKSLEDAPDPINTTCLRTVIDIAVTRVMELERTVAKHDAAQSPISSDIESALKATLEFAPLVNLMEPRLVCILPGILINRQLDHLHAVAKIACQHSLLRLPIRETLPPPMPCTDPDPFVLDYDDCGNPQVILRDPSFCTLEQMEHFSGLHPSVFRGEYSSIAFQDTWLDFEEQHGDTSEASRRFVPLAWLAVKLVTLCVRQDPTTREDDKAVCCEAVQLLDESTRDAYPFPLEFRVLREPLLHVAKEAEEACLNPAPSRNDEGVSEDQEEETPMDELIVKVLQYSRHPQSLRDALLRGEALAACRKALRDCGLSPELHLELKSLCTQGTLRQC